MAPIRPRYRLRLGVVGALLVGLVVAGIFWAISRPGEKEVLIWGGNEVSSTDTCVEFGGAGRKGSCADLARKEYRYEDTQGWAVAMAGGWLLLGLVGAGLAGREGIKFYKVQQRDPDSTVELEQIAALHDLGELEGCFVGARGAFVTKTSLVLGQFHGGLVRYELDERPRAYRWDEIASVRQQVSHKFENRQYKGTSFNHVLTFADGTTLPVRGSYRDPQWDPQRGDTQQAGYRFTLMVQKVNQAVAALRLPGARDTLAAGGTIDFGGIEVTANALRYKGSATAWAKVGAAVVKDGALTFPNIERRAAIVKKKAIGDIPNLPLLLVLSDELRQSSARGVA
ncbi:hypothetical protein [Nocardia sp. NPDC050406]|uniref:hypothetical protein n=1 Tax=Nocardia sp. NPDC050406 TaxID=3364318 RepID=UPI0037B63111